MLYEKLFNERVLIMVADGLGFSRNRQERISSEVWETLSRKERSDIASAASEALGIDLSFLLEHPQVIPNAAVHPIYAEAINPGLSVEAGRKVVNQAAAVRKILLDLEIAERVDSIRRKISLKHRYAPWAAKSPFITALRNSHLTLPTLAAGEWVGFEHSEIPFQGNSETGHQHIGSMVMAHQTSRIIADAIRNGRFFDNRPLIDTIQEAIQSEGNVAFCFMLSGVTGYDGGIHSSWRHLEAFAELLFKKLSVEPARVRMQAILDGRDSSANGSTEKSADRSGCYLERLRTLLEKYDASESLAWIVGRGIAMDRDYRENLAETDWNLLTKGAGLRVRGITGAIEAVERLHSEGFTDQTIPPIAVIGADDQPKVLSDGDSFINLNFRSDRQREKAASILGAKDFLYSKAKSRGWNWELKWLNPALKIRYCSIASCHPVLDAMDNASVAFPEQPLPASLLSLWPQSAKNATYALVTESVKALHMGYFFRGRREFPKATKAEVLCVVPSHSSSDNVLSDWDFHRFPEMRTAEVAEIVGRQTENPLNKLICCNLAATDMVGHLLPRRFEAAVKACEATDAAVKTICEKALGNGWNVILTSDHGNIEEDNPSHTANNVLTTIASPKCRLNVAENLPSYQARLFDIGYTTAVMLGMETEAANLMQKTPYPPGHKFAGRMLIERGPVAQQPQSD